MRTASHGTQAAKARVVVVATGLAGSGFHAHNSVRPIINATAQKFTGNPPPRAQFAAFPLGRLEAKIVGQSLHLALRDVKDKTRNAGYKIEFTRAGSLSRSNCDPLLTVIKYAGTLEQLRDRASAMAATWNEIAIWHHGEPTLRLFLHQPAKPNARQGSPRSIGTGMSRKSTRTGQADCGPGAKHGKPNPA